MIDDGALLLSSVEAGVATLTLNRPTQRNALSRAMITAFQSTLDRIKDDPAVRVVIVAAHGPAFCSGHDLKEIDANRSPDFYRTLFAACSRLMISILHLPQPVIARVHGVATAAGCQLVASCDLAIAADLARFATPGVNIGLFCSTPMVALSRTIARKQAMEMLLTGEAIDAETACRFGLINQAVPLADLERVTADLACRLASKSPLTLRIGKQAFYRQLELGVEDAYDYCSAVMTRNLATSDAAEGIDAFLNKRQPRWTGA